MKHSHAAFFVAALAGISGCKSRGFNTDSSRVKADESTVAKYIPPVPEEFETFSWTGSTSALSDAAGFVRRNLKDAIVNSQKAAGPGGRVNQEAEAGFGLYTAGDPFNSIDYGETLVVVPLRKGVSNIAWAKSTRGGPDLGRAAVVSNASGVFYSFGGLRFLGTNAIVFRTEAPLDLSRARAINTRTPQARMAAHAPVKEEPGKPLYESVLTQFGDHRPFLKFVAQNVQQFRTAGRDGSKTIIALMAARSDLEQANNPARKLFEAMKSTEAAATFPVCHETFTKLVMNPKYNTLEEKTNTCLDNYFGALAAATGDLNKFSWSGGPEESLAVKEVAAFLEQAKVVKSAAGIADFKTLAAQIVAENEGAIATARSVVESIDKIHMQMAKNSYDNLLPKE